MSAKSCEYRTGRRNPMTKEKQNEVSMTVHEATYRLLRKLGLTTVFGTRAPRKSRSQEFPKDFQYVLGLQEASAVRWPTVFTSNPKAGAGEPAFGRRNRHGMCNIMRPFKINPLIITAGQQTREMILCDPCSPIGRRRCCRAPG